jgi:chromosome segregation ATPase
LSVHAKPSVHGVEIVERTMSDRDVLRDKLRELQERLDVLEHDLAQGRSAEESVAEAEAQARMAALQREIEGLHAELALLQEQEEAQEERWSLHTSRVRHMREADVDRGDVDPPMNAPLPEIVGQEAS